MVGQDKMRIDLNSDLGESFGPWPMGQDAALMASISSANVACGFHAGDPGAMRATATDRGSCPQSLGAETHIRTTDLPRAGSVSLDAAIPSSPAGR